VNWTSVCISICIGREEDLYIGIEILCVNYYGRRCGSMCVGGGDRPGNRHQSRRLDQCEDVQKWVSSQFLWLHASAAILSFSDVSK